MKLTDYDDVVARSIARAIYRFRVACSLEHAFSLIWSLSRKDDGIAIRVFFLVCVIVAGVFGGITAKPSILYVQAAPALIALIVTLLARR